MKGVFLLQVKSEANVSDINRFIMMTNIGVLAHWRDKELSPLRPRSFTRWSPLMGRGCGFTPPRTSSSAKVRPTRRGWSSSKISRPGWAIRKSCWLIKETITHSSICSNRAGGENLPYDSEMLPYDRERYDGFIYADRALYRPGETVHLRWLGRKNYGDALAGVPLVIRVIKPNGKSLLEKPVTLSEWGTGALDVPTQKAYPTGRYEVQLSVPGESQSLASYAFQLEEFVPNRIKTAIEIPEPRWVGADTPHKLNVLVRHLFGAPAEGRDASAAVFFTRGWQPARWRGYHFDNDSECALDSVSLGEKQTDKEGKAAFEFAWQMPQQVTFPLSVSVLGNALETGGRKVAARGAVQFFPSPICLGLAGEPGKKDGEVSIRVAAVKPDENPAELAKVELTLEKQVWNYSVRDYSTYQEPRWTGKYDEVETRTLELKGGVSQAVFTAPDYGYYRVSVRSPETKQYSTLLFYSFGGQCQITESAEPSLVHLKLNKPLYKIGEMAELRVEAPFDGTAVVVIQGEAIRRMLTVPVRKNVGTARFRIQSEDFPNAWLEATVIHAVDKKRTQVYPFASFEMIKLPVEDPARRINVTLAGLPKEVRPVKPFTLEVQTRNGAGRPVPAEVTLAAVDEGIHSIKGYDNPDPYGYLSRSRRPDFRRAFYYDKVAYDFGQPTPGGDEDLAASMGRPTANWIRTVALWSGVVKTDKSGKAKITLDIPQFSGELRLVAVAVNLKATGMVAGSLLVRQPYILQTSMPRFLLPGDRAQCRATIYNTTDKPCRAMVGWTHGGVLAGGEGQRELKLAAHGEGEALAEFTAGRSVGQGQILWRVEILDATTSQSLDRLEENDPIPVAEPAAYQRRQDLRVLKPDQATSITNTFFLDDELTRLDLLVGAQPQLRLQKALSYVIEYPYGCVEQTTSKLLPLYLLRKNTYLVQATMKDAKEMDTYIRAGIDRLFSMQTASGGLAFWAGQDEPYSYGSIYALHALTLIRNGREYPVPENSFSVLQKYVRGVAEEGGDGAMSSLYQRAYAIFVLALGGDKKALDMIERFDSLTLPRPARFMLAAALARNTNDTDRVKLYLSSAPSQPWAVREADGTLSSDIRNTAVELMALSQIGNRRDQMAPRADQLSRFLESERYGTTQEYAFVTAALCDYLDAVTTDIQHAAALITQDGKESKLAGREVFSGRHKGPKGQFTIKNTGRTDLYVGIASRGVPAKAQAEEVREGLAVRRRFYTLEGKTIDGKSFKQGESYLVELEIYCQRDAGNVVIADLLPAGLEVENPRLNSNDKSGVKLPRGAVAPTHLEIRDERLVLVYEELEGCAADRPEDTHHFYYVVNAVTPGEFTYPAVSAECMYDPAVRGASKAAPVKVEAR